MIRRKGCEMTPIDFRKKKVREMQELLINCRLLMTPAFRPKTRTASFGLIRPKNEILDSSALQRLCSITEESAGRPAEGEA
jgi:hypothetical protein